MIEIKVRKYSLTVKESKRLIDEALSKFPGIEAVIKRRKTSLQALEVPWKGKTAKVLFYEGEPLLVQLPDGTLLPFLTAVEKYHLSIPKVVIDKGAIMPVAKGAHVMGPGIVRVEGEFNPGDVVVVVEETRGYVIAVGLAERPHAEAKERGRTVKNLHHAGDPIWRAVASQQ